jgi:lambda repressor-like predicted transcriptional regulator
MGTDQPFHEAVRGVLAERGLTFRALAARTSEVESDGKGLSHSYLTTLGTHDRPTPRAMEIVARALDLRPTFFAEYRLGLVRGLFDEEQQGLPRALQNLQALQDLVDAQVPAPPAGSLSALLSTALEGPPRRRSATRQRTRS